LTFHNGKPGKHFTGQHEGNLIMAKGDKNTASTERQPVTARGSELLALIAGAGAAGLMLTQEEGMDAVNAGHATVDTTVTEGNTAKVTLTDAGRDALTSTGGGSATKFEIKDGFVAPEAGARRGRQSAYPFDMLEVGQYFDVAPANGETNEKVISRLQSSVSGARARYAEETGETRNVKVRDYQQNADGSFAKDAEGKRIVTAERTESRPVKVATRDFKVIPNPDGPGARVGRIK
jgi:hypothetical protein